MSQTIPESKKLTRYRVTLDVMIDDNDCLNPYMWNWYNLLQQKEKNKLMTYMLRTQEIMANGRVVSNTSRDS